MHETPPPETRKPRNPETPQRVVELVANVDDVTGEQAGAAIDTLIGSGALDAWVTPIVMKKGRPAMMISVLADESLREKLTELLITLTGTLGVRHRMWDRTILDRRFETMTTEFGQLRVKVGSLNGRDVTAKCEFDDAADAAAKHGVTVREVSDAAMAAYHGRDRV